MSKVKQNKVEEPKYFKTLDLPLSKFEDCMLNNNLSALVISGFPSEDLLAGAWSDIMQEYSEALGDSEYVMYVELYRSLELLRLDYESVGVLIAALRKVYSAFFCSELNGILRTRCDFNPKDPASYFAQLDKCERRAKSMKIQLDLKRIEFEGVQKKMLASDKGEKRLDKNYFTSVLIILEKHWHFPLTKDMMVSKYVEYLKQYALYTKEVQKATKKR